MNDKTNNPTHDASREFRVVELTREPIELYKVLKFENMVVSGGEAKAAIAAGTVLVNGEVETQKRKKILSGDTIEFGEDRITLKLSELDSAKANAREETTPGTKKSAAAKPAIAAKQMRARKKAVKKRKAISVRSKGK